MPELPEVETVRRHLQACVVGRQVEQIHAAQVRLRTPLLARPIGQLMRGGRIVAVRRRAKYLLIDIDGEGVGRSASIVQRRGSLLVHLGMSGRVRWQKAPHLSMVHDHLVMHTTCGHSLTYHDPRRFGLVEVLTPGAEAVHPRLVHLGIEPLDPQAFDGAWLFARTRGKSTPIKNWLMNAAEVVGIGNIYASEALFGAGVHPTRPAGSLSAPACTRLADAAVAVLQQAIACGGTTLRDFAGADGQKGLFMPQLKVYGRNGAPCVSCQRPLLRRVMAGRSTFYCGRCQR